MLCRVLEPEVMDTPQEAADYDAMDHSQVNRVFVDDLLPWLVAPAHKTDDWPPHPVPCWPFTPPAPSPPARAELAALRDMRVLDVGTGTARIPIELCQRGFGGDVVAIDLAASMLDVAARNVQASGCAQQVHLRKADAKQISEPDRSFDAVVSNSIVHHIPEPLDVLREAVRVLRPGGILFFRDLLRPVSDAQVEHFVATYTGQESADQQQLFRQSLYAALSLAELQQLLARLGLPETLLRQTSDRHWTIAGRIKRQ